MKSACKPEKLAVAHSCVVAMLATCNSIIIIKLVVVLFVLVVVGVFHYSDYCMITFTIFLIVCGSSSSSSSSRNTSRFSK